MVYRKKRNLRRRKNYRKRKLNLSSKSAPYLKNSFGLPLRKKVSMRYCEEFPLASTAGGVVGYSFNANGLYDPNQSGIGHQPMGFDQWMTFYNHYTVIGAVITCQFTAVSSTAPMVVGCMSLDDGSYTGTNTITGRCEHPRCIYKTMANSGADEGVTIKQSLAPLKILSKKIGDDDASGNVAANPTETVGFSVWVAGLGNASASCDILVTIDYIVILSEPRELVQS